MNKILNPPWVFASQHGQEVLELLAKLDKSEQDDRECNKLKKCEGRKKETAECCEAECVQKTVKISQYQQNPCSPRGILVYNMLLASLQVSLFYVSI
ncbi:hypothetical protein L208DRAFT_1317345 [Tricholoma matsutake]|nr:hypothetical protein L208DRAFT_1317345 [Tricholoma matsutake 945]